MSYWIVPSSLNPNTLEVIKRKGQRPKNAIMRAPVDRLTGEPEEGQWLTIQEVNDPETNQPRKVAVVDKALKAQIRAERRARRDQIRQEQQEEKNKINVLRKKFRDFRKNDISSLEDVQEALDDIVQILKILAKNL